MKRSNFMRTVLFLLCFACIFFIIQKILTPKWNYPYFCEYTQKSFSDFQKLEKKSIDALFLGFSHASLGISPLQIYEETGISTYNLASSQQPIDGSLFLLYEALKRQRPKYVFLDAGSLFLSPMQTHEGRTYIIDSFNTSKNKLRLEVSQGNGMGLKKNLFHDQKTFLGAIFPFYKYHKEWTKITQSNFKTRYRNTYSTFGFELFSHNSGHDQYWINPDNLEDLIVQAQKNQNLISYKKDENILPPPIRYNRKRENSII